MDEILEKLKRAGVHNIKNDKEILLEVLEERLNNVVEIDNLIYELLTKIENVNLKKVRLECPKTLLDRLNYTKSNLEVVGERVIFTKSFKEPINNLVPKYEVWSITDPKSISFLSEVMGRNFKDTEKFLMSMKVELPLQASKMYTVYIINNEPVGVVFPHIEPDTNKEGRMFWIGIHPNFLSKGLGKNLHLIGLYRLQQEFKAKSYLGATQVEIFL